MKEKKLAMEIINLLKKK